MLHNRHVVLKVHRIKRTISHPTGHQRLQLLPRIAISNIKGLCGRLPTHNCQLVVLADVIETVYLDSILLANQVCCLVRAVDFLIEGEWLNNLVLYKERQSLVLRILPIQHYYVLLRAW